jgi:RimJ/RimL family protein N-acetyltransferase
MKPNPEIKTDRLVLRPINTDDADALFAYRSDSIANQYQGWIPNTIRDAHDFIRNRISPVFDVTGTWFQFVIIKREQDELIGDIGIHFLDTEKKQVEIGFTLDKRHQGKGYASEALKAVIHYLFKKSHKHRITASIDPDNSKSIRLVERLGFRKEAHFKSSVMNHGKWADDLVYAILEDEWNQKHIHAGIK